MWHVYFQQLFIFIMCSTSSYLRAEGLIISVAPVDTVGCYGGISTFYCESERSDIHYKGWTIIVDGMTYAITDEIAQLRGISITTNGVGNSSLSIIGSEDNNGIIGCTVVTLGPPYFDSHTALFTVSDIPPVTNLTITFTNNGTIMNCTWIQPSCLPVNYWYSISINNVTVTNTTSTIYSINNIESCTNYTVSVTVTDGQYQSIPAIETVTTRYFNDLKVYLDKNAYFTDTFNRFNRIEFQVVSVNYKQRLRQLFHNCKANIVNKIIPSMYSDVLYSTVEDLLKSYNSSTGIGYYTIGPFNDSFRGNYTVQIQEEEEIATTEISTFNVQNGSVNQTLNGTVMECSFAFNSPAEGCLFKLVSQATGNVTVVNVTKEEDEDTATLYTDLDIHVTEGDYDVHVYDIVDGEIIGNLSAYDLSYYHVINEIVRPPGDSTSSVVLSSTYLSIPSSILNTRTIQTPTATPSSPTKENTLSSTLPSFVLIAIVCGVTGIVLLTMIIVIGFMMAVKVNCRRRQKAQCNYNADLAMVKLNTATPHLYDDLPAAVNVTAIQQNTSVTPIIQHSSPLITSQNDTAEQANVQVTNVDHDGDYMVNVDDLRRNSATELELRSVRNAMSQTQSPLCQDVPSTDCKHEPSSITHTDPLSATTMNTQSHDTESQCLPIYDDVVTRPDTDYDREQDIKESLVCKCQQYTSDSSSGFDFPSTLSSELKNLDKGANDSERDQLISSPSSVVNNKPSSHDRIPSYQYAQLDLHNQSSTTTTVSDSPHCPIPRINDSKPVYATTIDLTKKVCAQQCSGYPVYVNTGLRKQNEQNPIIVNGKVVGNMSPSEDSDGFTLVHGVTQQNNGLEDDELCVCNEIMVACQEESHTPSPDRYGNTTNGSTVIIGGSFPLPFLNGYSTMSVTNNNKQNDGSNIREHSNNSEMSEFHEHCQSLHESIHVGGVHVYFTPLVMRRNNWTIPTHEDTRQNLVINSETMKETETTEESNDSKPSFRIDNADTNYLKQVVTYFHHLLKLVFDGGGREGDLSFLCLLFGLIFDGGGMDQGMGNPNNSKGKTRKKVLNIITWWYVFRKWLYDKIVNELNLIYVSIT